MENREKQLQSFGRLLDIMDTLREKCPWDHKQTFESLRPQTIEEVYELSDALLNNDMKNISKELGDVLLHVVFYAKLGSESGTFDIGDVIDRLCEKLIYRHPHIYGDTVAEDAGQVIKNWEQLKQAEKDGHKKKSLNIRKKSPPKTSANNPLRPSLEMFFFQLSMHQGFTVSIRTMHLKPTARTSRTSSHISKWNRKKQARD